MPTFPANPLQSLSEIHPRYDLGESYGPELRLADLLTPELGDLPLGYGTAQGDPALRAAIAAQYDVEPDQVVVTIGAQHAIFLLSFLLADPGSQVITTAPLFPLARNVCETIGADVEVIPLSFDSGYQVRADDVRARLTPDTKLVSLASPQNPSGVAVPLPVLREISTAMATVCPEAVLLVDDTYRVAAYGDDSAAQSALVLGPKVVTTASLSKCHGSAGLRAGWVISTDPELVQRLTTAKFSTVVSGSPVTEALAVRVFELQDGILAERRQRLADGLAATAAWVQENAELVEWVRPDAGALCCIRLRPQLDLDRFRSAAAGLGVRLADGEWFTDEPRVFRLGFGYLPPVEFKAALEALTTALHKAVVAPD
ncbi:pyridoxal phosphate-dependent aminotransferase [Kribbella sandramycini]|uniref:Aspartate/methionine/tyrosine aminotransferase n=1 Tax=Kribbella sandramycini TaxID=60450 RepID=A0A7Y4P3J1_9ACTN|nr:pyridoxal phosphate-dependent aminotransferase [Kribbella sandramycini]MBB6566108.1 aspartate/methionine/tyrosine aminotransferase [Kribbella sandramycini]NOL45108.1 pyridoxal phosphate-dependent aminotransferase [Kribbella sandramycini]